MGVLLKSLKYVLKIIGKAITASLQLIFISIVLALHAGVIYAGTSGSEDLLFYMTIGSAIAVIVPLFIKHGDPKGTDGEFGADGEEVLFLLIFAVGAYYEGIIGKLVFVLRYGLVVTTAIGWWMIRGGSF
jgi:preprotein translocase subunit SecG